MININPKMLPRLDEIEADLLARQARAEAEGWLGEIEGIDLTSPSCGRSGMRPGGWPALRPSTWACRRPLRAWQRKSRRHERQASPRLRLPQVTHNPGQH